MGSLKRFEREFKRINNDAIDGKSDPIHSMLRYRELIKDLLVEVSNLENEIEELWCK